MDLNCYFEQWQCSPQIDKNTFAQIRRYLALNCYKWDAQVGDVSALATFALMLPQQIWTQLAALAEQLTTEANAAELELVQNPELIKELGLPRQIIQVISNKSVNLTPAAARVVRFDFHPTANGWQISEANYDVPGRYTEAANFSKLMAQQFPGTTLAGDPASQLVDALTQKMQPGGHIALLSAAGYMEDQQITAYLAELLYQRGCITHLANPHQIHWQNGVAHLKTEWYRGSLDAVMRFYQGEWLIQLTRNCDWSYFFRGSQTPICNPGSALLIESKRFPLVWKRLTSSLNTWKALLPETRDPRQVNWLKDRSWLLKSAFCNTGDTVMMPGVSDRSKYKSTVCHILLHPHQWIAQRCFQTLPLTTPIGIMYPCIGVYTVNGKAAGIYGRIAPKPLIDFAAIDVAVLIQK
ncbi:glutathionylspermidine synthase family protein [Nostoc cycadae]|uniref:Glutathionylspermidine synthase n=1 Tax=Nostoc cycadae WK-1 TaxID=1861711 RepID=A0A2H6LD90_9NOSO|nr:glutathionylspermidine synthase family protein [Nostoc cycadae]GBE91195.1 glutathionylspermidine synthase [Nostoc cycadae WK-1]